MGKAYAIPDKGVPPQLPEGKEWIVLRLAMGILGKHPCNKGIPKKMRKAIVPYFTMVATDRKVAVAEVTDKIRELFDAWEEGERLEKAKGEKR